MRYRPVLLWRLLKMLPLLIRSGAGKHYSAADLFEQCVRRSPQRVYLRFEGRAVTYAELDAEANRVAHWALAQGLRSGDVVALLMGNRPEYLAVWIGLAKLGVTTALLNTHLTGKALAHCVAEAASRCVIVGAECADGLGDVLAGMKVHVLADGDRDAPAGSDGLREALDACESTRPDPSLRAEVVAGDALFYIYTSGTTGLPKAARFSHSRFVSGGSFHLLAGLGRNDVLYCPLPLYHTVGGVLCVNATLRTGATLALSRRFSTSRFWDEVHESDATAFQYIGELCRYLLNQPEHPRERSHRLRFGLGNGLRPDIWDEFQRRFAIPRMVEFYGATESNVSLLNLDGRSGSVGQEIPGTSPRLVRIDLDTEEPVRGADGLCVPCGVDEPGELLGMVKQGTTAAGRYEGYTDRAATEKKLLRDVQQRGDCWFRTGDLLRRDAEGYYYFVDRMGDTFRWKGENVSTQEVAEAVGSYPGTEMCAVYGVEIAGQEGRAGMAALVLAPGASIDPEALFAHVEQRLPAYARPAFVRLRTAHDMTGTLKIRKVELQREGFDPAVVTEPLLCRDDSAKRYQKLDAELHAQVLAGRVRL